MFEKQTTYIFQTSLKERTLIMFKFYEKMPILFAVLWIVLYCVVSIPIRGELGDESVWMLVGLAAIAAGITAFIKIYHLEEKYGLTGFPKNIRRYLYFIPMCILVTGNLWGGFAIAYPGVSQVFAVLSMLLIGYIEEILFRGFLFKALLPKDGVKLSVVITAATFGIGHIVNLFAGQASVETVIQVFFAIAWGFIFTMVFYKSGSLIPCIIAHGLVDALSKFAAENIAAEWVYMTATIVIAIAYCIYLGKLKTVHSAQ